MALSQASLRAASVAKPGEPGRWVLGVARQAATTSGVGISSQPHLGALKKESEKDTFVATSRDTDDVNCTASGPGGRCTVLKLISGFAGRGQRPPSPFPSPLICRVKKKSTCPSLPWTSIVPGGAAPSACNPGLGQSRAVTAISLNTLSSDDRGLMSPFIGERAVILHRHPAALFTGEVAKAVPSFKSSYETHGPLGPPARFAIQRPPSPSLSPSPDEVVTSHGAIEADKDHVRQEPYSLPQGFMWDTLDLGSAEVVSTRPARGTAQRAPSARSAPSDAASLLLQLRELYTLLNENYVEDDGNMFRFDYSPEFLLWWVPPAAWGARVRVSPVPVSPPPQALTGASFPCLR